MRGSVVKRVDAKGKARYYAVIEDVAADGTRRRRWHSDPATGSAFTSKRDAEKALSGLVVAVQSGGYVAPASLTVGEWADRWLARAEDRLRPSTLASYEKNLRVHVKPHIGEVRLQSLSAAHLDDMYARLRVDGKHVKGHQPSPLSARTVRYVHVITKALLSDAVRYGILSRNPADGATPPSAKSTSAATGTLTTWAATDVADFLEGAQAHRYGPLFAFLALSGARRGEALGLRWTDVDIGRRRASITSSVGRVSGKIIEGGTKTGAGRRPIALDSSILDALAEQRARQHRDRDLVGAGYRDQGLVFAAPEGSYVNPEHVSRVFKSEVQRLGLPPIRLHDLRHTWATLALQSGVHPRVVQERLGHSNVTITLQVYSHVAPLMHDEAAATVAGLIEAARDPKVTRLRQVR
ncbi:MAG: tyrosine-type recombinase/integrase [Candidatus Nanopelagicales bacterium]|nr:tyrosine-type recombinase/integrase [Candidatus Nanopelagicales bacterium]MDZ4250088.1 tyrosine-type recombinase/integrase [Candidatus Nanopelagicales bacterium]